MVEVIDFVETDGHQVAGFDSIDNLGQIACSCGAIVIGNLDVLGATFTRHAVTLEVTR